MVLLLNVLTAPAERNCSYPQHPHGGLQPSSTPIPEDPTPSQTSEDTCGIHTSAAKVQ